MNLTDEEILKARKKNRELLTSDNTKVIEELKIVSRSLIEEAVDVLDHWLLPATHEVTYRMKSETELSYFDCQTIQELILQHCRELTKTILTTEEREKYTVRYVTFKNGVLRIVIEGRNKEVCIIS